MKQSLIRHGLIWVVVLLLAACVPERRLPVPTSASTVSAKVFVPFTSSESPLLTPTGSPAPVALSTSTPSETAPVPTASPLPPTCTSWKEIDAAFTADVELPDDTRLPPRTTFRKTWRVRNTGECAWPDGMQLKHIAGSPLPGSQAPSIAYTAPGGEADVSITFTTPARLGKHESYWRLRSPEGRLVGAVLFTRFVVDAKADYHQGEPPEPPLAPVETATPTPLLPPTATGVPATATGVPATSTRAPTLMPTPTLTRTPPPLPSATPPEPAPGGGEGDACPAPDPRFAPVVEVATLLKLKPFCALEPVQEEMGLVQLYWSAALIPAAGGEMPTVSRSIAILSQEARRVTVLGSKDPAALLTSFAAYESSWRPTMPARSPTCEILVPPAGAVFPTESLGDVWCTESLWLTIGWPIAPPVAARLATQATGVGQWEGLLMEVRAGSTTYLIAVDYDQRRAVVYEMP